MCKLALNVIFVAFTELPYKRTFIALAVEQNDIMTDAETHCSFIGFSSPALRFQMISLR